MQNKRKDTTELAVKLIALYLFTFIGVFLLMQVIHVWIYELTVGHGFVFMLGGFAICILGTWVLVEYEKVMNED